MVNEHAYAPPLAETARENIRAVVEVLMTEIKLTETFLSRFAKGDSAFLKRLPETSMNIRTYDEVMARLSAAFPEDLSWPDEVPRPAPADLDEASRKELEAMMIHRRAVKAQEEAREARLAVRRAKAEASEKTLKAREVSKTARNVTAGAAAAPASI